MKALLSLVALAALVSTSFAGVVYDAGTTTVTYQTPADLTNIIDPPGPANGVDVGASYGNVALADFRNLVGLQVMDFNVGTTSTPLPMSALKAQYSASGVLTVGFNEVAYNWGGVQGSGRLQFSGDQQYMKMSSVQGTLSNNWFHADLSTNDADEGVSAFGLCAAFRNDTGNSAGQAIFTLSDGSTVNSTFTLPSRAGTTSDPEWFVGYQAPAGLSITNVLCTRPGAGNSYASIDDMSFVISEVPEPATMSILLIGGIGALLKRRSH